MWVTSGSHPDCSVGQWVNRWDPHSTLSCTSARADTELKDITDEIEWVFTKNAKLVDSYEMVIVPLLRHIILSIDIALLDIFACYYVS